MSRHLADRFNLTVEGYEVAIQLTRDDHRRERYEHAYRRFLEECGRDLSRPHVEHCIRKYDAIYFSITGDGAA